MSENEPNGIVATRRSACRIAGMILFSAFVASCFVWGPLGLIFYVGGRFNSFSVHVLTLPLLMAAPLMPVLLLILIVRSVVRWRRLSERGKVLSMLLIVALAAPLASVGLGIAGVTPSSFDMFVRGFTRYVEARADVPAIQAWLGTLDPKEYVDANIDSGGMPLPPDKYPPAITRLSPERYPHNGVRVGQKDSGKLRVRLMWGGGFIGHWGIEVGDRSMQPPADSETVRHRPLAPGAWVWSNST